MTSDVTIEDERNTALLDWYRRERRPLPWRSTHDPYRILISEVMLQQTQAGRVVPFYERFLAAYPTVGHLAEAPLSEVLARWNGLGYNSRAKRLHDAAKAVVARGWPDDVAGLETLPGVGPYTARAIASFAFGQRVAAVDTNLRRVLSRWHGEVLSGASLERAADVDLAEDAATWNQAMMDLGATVCRPRNPGCDVCPVENWCAGPGAYEPPRRQGRFEGSARQLRGTIVRNLVKGPAPLDTLVAVSGFDARQVESALMDLTAEGLVLVDGDLYRLAD